MKNKDLGYMLLPVLRCKIILDMLESMHYGGAVKTAFEKQAVLTILRTLTPQDKVARHRGLLQTIKEWTRREKPPVYRAHNQRRWRCTNMANAKK